MRQHISIGKINPITVRCIDNELLDDALVIGQEYVITEGTSELYAINGYAYAKNRFEIVEDNKNNKNTKYWYYNLETKDYNGNYSKIDGVSSSDNGLFPLRHIEEQHYDVQSINYKIVIEISKEDYEWKYSDMSKF